MVDAAKERDLSIERGSTLTGCAASGTMSDLCDSNQAKIWHEDGNDAVIVYNGGIYYNPASEDARELIIDGVQRDYSELRRGRHSL
jgi:hypothetical protein